MDSLVGFFIYATIFRLAIIAAGIVSIVLGYKLFVLGVIGGEKTRINAQAGQIRLTLANAGPGLGFALLGVFAILVMLIQGNPEYLKEEYKEQLAKCNCSSKVETAAVPLPDEQQVKTRTSEYTIQKYKGGNNNNEDIPSVNQALNEAKQLQHAGDIESAIKIYRTVLSDSKTPFILNELAWLYKEKQQRVDEALLLAHAATTIDRNNANAFDTLALILLDKKELDAAEQAVQTALKLDPDNQDYKETLKKIHTH
ncbi:MAG: hypothetical protein D3904_09350, partial [Candidatus Electrothrix sp. EH2]|nr:hypothetical protein [Candidatus Electrothrix sp. EH2]